MEVLESEGMCAKAYPECSGGALLIDSQVTHASIAPTVEQGTVQKVTFFFRDVSYRAQGSQDDAGDGGGDGPTGSRDSSNGGHGGGDDHTGSGGQFDSNQGRQCGGKGGGGRKGSGGRCGRGRGKGHEKRKAVDDTKQEDSTGATGQTVPTSHLADKIEQRDVWVHVSKSGGALLSKDGVVKWLEEHPCKMGDKTRCILTQTDSELTLKEVSVPVDARRDLVHARTIWNSTERDVLVRAVWLAPELLDEHEGVQRGTTRCRVATVKRWVSEEPSDHISASTADANGIFVTLGNGILPGKGRTSVSLNGARCNIPFSRCNPARSDAMEPLLSELCSSIGSCIEGAFEDEEGKSSESGVRSEFQRWLHPSEDGVAVQEELDWRGACQYPRAPVNGVTLPSHQVVVRGHKRDEHPNWSASDMHVDPMDGGQPVGSAVIFFGGEEEDTEQWDEFAVLETPGGGNGVRVRVLQGDWICVLIFDSKKCLHGTILKTSDSDDTQSTRSQSSGDEVTKAMHVVAYKLHMMESFIRNVEAETTEKQHGVQCLLDERMQRRLQRRLTVTSQRRKMVHNTAMHIGNMNMWGPPNAHGGSGGVEELELSASDDEMFRQMETSSNVAGPVSTERARGVDELELSASDDETFASVVQTNAVHTLRDSQPGGVGQAGPFMSSKAWLFIMYDLDELRTAGEFEIRTTIGELRAAQAAMPYFEIGARSSAISVLRVHEKRPYMVARIIHLEAGQPGLDVVAVVEDETGQMNATIDVRAVQQHGTRIQVGTCVILRSPPLFAVAAWDHHIVMHHRCITVLRTETDAPPPAPSLSPSQWSLSPSQWSHT